MFSGLLARDQTATSNGQIGYSSKTVISRVLDDDPTTTATSGKARVSAARLQLDEYLRWIHRQTPQVMEGAAEGSLCGAAQIRSNAWPRIFLTCFILVGVGSMHLGKAHISGPNPQIVHAVMERRTYTTVACFRPMPKTPAKLHSQQQQ